LCKGLVGEIARANSPARRSLLANDAAETVLSLFIAVVGDEVLPAYKVPTVSRNRVVELALRGGFVTELDCRRKFIGAGGYTI
jgi:hypothetical protein